MNPKQIIISLLTGLGMFFYYVVYALIGMLRINGMLLTDIIGRFLGRWDNIILSMLLILPFILTTATIILLHKKGKKEAAKAMVFGIGAIFSVLVLCSLAIWIHYMLLYGD